MSIASYLDNKKVKITLSLSKANFRIYINPEDYITKYKIEQTFPSREWNGMHKYFSIPISNAMQLEEFVNKYCKDNSITVESDCMDVFNEYAKVDKILLQCCKATKMEDLPPEVASLIDTYQNDIGPPPFEHQKVAYCTMLYGYEHLNNFLLFDEMGLGKTREIVDVGSYLLRVGKIDKVVIVCPATLKRVWMNEIEANTKYSQENLDIMIIGGNATTRGDLEHAIAAGTLRGRTKWIIFNYESSWRSEYFKALCENALIVADEAHKLKNPKAKQTKGFQSIAGLGSKIILATGTPIVNNPLDLYNLTDLAKPGSLGHNYFRFQRLFAYLKETRYGTETDGYKNIEVVRKIVGSYSLRRLKEDCLNLPEKLFTKRYIEMDDEQSEHYIRMVNELRTTLNNMKDEPLDITIKAAIVLLMRLQQICDGFLTDGPRQAFLPDGGAKVLELDNLIEEIVENSNKQAIIWTRFVPPIKYLMERYKQFNPVAIYGAISSVEGSDGISLRDKEIDKFKAGESKILIGQLHTAGLGLTLTNCHQEILLDRWWSPTVNNQAIDRCHRIGQKNSVTITELITEPSDKMKKKLGNDIKTMDQIVYDINVAKTKLSKEFIDTNNDAEEITMSEILQAAGLK